MSFQWDLKCYKGKDAGFKQVNGLLCFVCMMFKTDCVFEIVYVSFNFIFFIFIFLLLTALFLCCLVCP